MEEAKVFKGACLCKRIQLEVSGQPLAQGYCHCRGCQVSHAAPFRASIAYVQEGSISSEQVRGVMFHNVAST